MMIKQKRKLNQHIIQSLTSDFKVAHVEPFLIYWEKKSSYYMAKLPQKHGTVYLCVSVVVG